MNIVVEYGARVVPCFLLLLVILQIDGGPHKVEFFIISACFGGLLLDLWRLPLDLKLNKILCDIENRVNLLAAESESKTND